MNLTWTRDPIALILTALCAWRLTHLWISDTLPPLPRVRLYLGRRIDARWLRQKVNRRRTKDQLDDLKRAYSDTPPLSYLLDCYWCAGFWISLATTAAASFIPPPVWAVISIPFALSAVVGLIGPRD